MRALGLVLVTFVAGGCIIEPPDLQRLDGGVWDGGNPTPWDPPIPPIDWDGDINWDGGPGGKPDSGTGQVKIPGGGGHGDPGTGVLWLVRIDRGTANLAASYASLIQTMNQELAGQGFDVQTTAVGSLYSPQVYWAGEGKTLAVDDLRQRLEEAASTASGPPTECSSHALTLLGGQLGQTAVWNSGVHPFQTPSGALLVVLLDHAARPRNYEPACDPNMRTPANRFGQGREATQWLNTGIAGGWNLPRAQTRFLFVSTSERENYAQMRERCASLKAFPRTALDALAPSSIPFYRTFHNGLNERQAGLATQFDLCQAVAGDWAGFSRDFARSWVQWLTLPEEQR